MRVEKVVDSKVAKILKVTELMEGFRLDPITIVLLYSDEDTLANSGLFRGTVVVQCFDRSWTAYWGNMGRELPAFIARADAGYLCDNLIRGLGLSHRERQRQEPYLLKVCNVVKLSCEVAFKVKPKTKAQLERDERINHVNEVVRHISSYGSRFFTHEGRVAKIVELKGKLWWLDDYKGTPVFIDKISGYQPAMRGFSHGGTLRELVLHFRDYIRTGKKVHRGYIGASYWGYDQPSTEALKLAVASSPCLI